MFILRLRLRFRSSLYFLQHRLYINRSAAYASLRLWDKAIADGNECVRLRPDWAKGYCRLGAAYEGLSDLARAEAAYTEGLEREPENALLQISLFRVCSNEPRSDKAQGRQQGTHAVSGRGEGREAPALGGYLDPKQLGNSAFRKRDFAGAVEHFTSALDKETDGHVRALLLSNRYVLLLSTRDTACSCRIMYARLMKPKRSARVAFAPGE